MQKKKWVRVGLAAVIVGGAIGGISAAGCSGDDSTGVTPGKDGGSDSSIPQGDSGPTGDSSMPTGDTGTGDGSDGSVKLPNAKVYLLHAAADPNARPLRFCFGLNPTDAGTATVAGGIDPFPDFVTVPGGIAGLYPGFGGSTAASPKLATFDLSTLTIALYAVDAASILNNTADGGPDGGAEVPCEGLIGNDALGKGATSPGNGATLTLNSQFWYLGTILKGTLNHGQTWVAAVTGCFAGEDSSDQAFCPSSPPYGANGNLSLKAWQLDNTTVVAADGGIGAQFASASPSWDTANTLYGGVTGTTAAGFWIETPPVIPDSGTPETGGGEAGASDGGDAATDGAADTGTVEAGPPPGPTLTLIPITGTGTYGSITPKLVTVPVPLNSPAAGFFSSFITADGGAVYFPPGCSPGTGCASPLILPLPAIDQLTNGTVPTGGSFADGKGYAFILLGDPLNSPYINPLDGGGCSTPTPTTCVYNGKSAHFLGLPTSNP
jgi:hypothetical protein